MLFSLGSGGAGELGSLLLFLFLSALLFGALNELVDRVASGGGLPLVSAPPLLAIRAHWALLRCTTRLNFGINLDSDVRR